MLSPEEVVVREPEDKRGAWHSLLANNQYEQISNCLEIAYTQAVNNDEVEKAALLSAARQLCASCDQLQQEVSFHEQAYQQVETRRDQMDAELSKLLEKMEIKPTTAVATPQSTLWQRINRLWHREKQPLPKPPEPGSPARKNGTVTLETAVRPISQPSLPEFPFSNTNPTCPQLTIYCLGTFRVYEDEHPIEDWPSRKGKAIFKYLLLYRQQRITKEVLMAQFWPEATADAARNNLNVAIYGLRQALRNGYPDFSHVLFQDDCYFLNPEMEIWVDVEQFETIYKKACQKIQRGDTAVALPDLHAAELLYQGELLAEDRYEDWLTVRRQQLQRHYLQLLAHLCDHYFAMQQYATCTTFANKLLHVEPCHEATHRLLMRAYARQRQGYLALRQYHQCVELLAEELAVPPDPATTRLYEAIRNHEPI